MWAYLSREKTCYYNLSRALMSNEARRAQGLERGAARWLIVVDNRGQSG
jgi:hypothetical protein